AYIITYGTAVTTITGQLSGRFAGQPVPAGELVQVGLNGQTLNATLSQSGAFSVDFSTSTLGVAGSPYTIGFNYSGDAHFNPASGTSILIVNPVSPTFSHISAPSIVIGQPATVTGQLMVHGGLVPTGQFVLATLNGVTQAAPVDASGNFATTFATG